MLRDARLWGEDLTAIPTFAEAVSAAIVEIEALGTRAALALRVGA